MFYNYMKNVAVINIGDFSSVGRIATGLHQYLLDHGFNSHFFYCRGQEPKDQSYHKFEGEIERHFHALATRITGRQGCYSFLATKRLISLLEELEIDTIFGECLHGYFINEKMLFEYIAKKHIKYVYVLIDEYPYLGKCWNSNGCTNYMHGCGNCPQKKVYPQSYLFDGSSYIFKRKAALYPKMERCVFAGPEFLITNAKKSPLMKGVLTQIVDQGIDVDFNSPQNNTDALREKLGIDKDKIILFSNASYKYTHKGGMFFVELAKRLEHDKRFIFVHAGNEKQLDNMPSNYIFVGFVGGEELPSYYSMADLFVFPSMQDAMPNACLESLACGTPLLCFDISGLPYIAGPDIETLVKPGDINALLDIVQNSTKKDDKVIARCREYALNRYDRNIYFEKLVKCAVD